MTILKPVLIAFALLLTAGAPGGSEHGGETVALGYVPGASRLEGRLMSPCCWQQTLDIHSSPIASELRHEIRTRLKRGESADAIEASLVDRYGERILAVPPDSPLKSMAVVLSALMGIFGIGAFVMLRRWRQSPGRTKEPPARAGGDADDALESRVDEELARLDE